MKITLLFFFCFLITPQAVLGEEAFPLSERLFEFAEKHNPGYKPGARAVFESWVRELNAMLPGKNDFASQAAVWSDFLYSKKKLECVTGNPGDSFFIDDLLTSGQGSPLGIAALWAALAERLKVPFYLCLSPKRPFVSYGTGAGNTNISVDNPRQFNGLQYFALASGILPADQNKLPKNSAYFHPLAAKQIIALHKQAAAMRMAQAGKRDAAKKLLFESRKEFPGVAQMSDDLARLFLEAGARASARREFERSVRIFAKDLFALQSLSRILWEEGDLTRAKEYSERALEINPDDTEVIRRVIKIKILREGLRTAEADILQYARLRPEDPEAMLFRGMLLYFGGSELASLDIFNKVMEKNGNDAEILVIYGLRYFLQGTWGLEGFFWKSMEYFRRAEEKNPEHWMAQYLIGLVYLYTHQYPRAKETFEALLEKTPRSPDVLLRLARALAELGKFQEAVARIREAEALEPQTPSLRFAKALLYFRQARLKEAIREMELAVAQAPYLERNLWRLVLADICIESNEIDKAAEVVDQVLAEHPQNPRANLLLGRIHIERKEWDMAEKRLDVAIHGAGENGEALRLFAKAEFGRGDVEKAWHYIRAAQRVGTHDPELMAELRKTSKEPKGKKVEHVVVTK